MGLLRAWEGRAKRDHICARGEMSRWCHPADGEVESKGLQRWNLEGDQTRIKRSPGFGAPERPPRPGCFVPVLPKLGLTERLTSPRSNPTCSHRSSHARSPTVKHYCPSHGALWFEELSRPLSFDEPAHERNLQTYSCCLSPPVVPTITSQLYNPHVSLTTLATYAAGNIFHATT